MAVMVRLFDFVIPFFFVVHGLCDDTTSALQTIFRTNTSRKKGSLETIPLIKHSMPCVWLRMPWNVTNHKSGNNQYTNCMQEVWNDDKELSKTGYKYMDGYVFASSGGAVVAASSSWYIPTYNPKVYSTDKSAKVLDFVKKFKEWIVWMNLVANFTLPAAHTAHRHHHNFREQWIKYKQFFGDKDIPLEWNTSEYRAFMFWIIEQHIDFNAAALGDNKGKSSIKDCKVSFNLWKRMNETLETI